MSDRRPKLARPIALGDDAVLRRWRDKDAASVVAASNDPELARWIPVPRPYTITHAQLYIENTRSWWQAGERFVLCIDRGGEAVGSVALRLDGDGPAIGYWLAPAARGSGLMTRAVEAMVRWATETLGIKEFWIYVQPENRASRAVAERADFTERGERSDFPDGKRRLVYRRRLQGEEDG